MIIMKLYSKLASERHLLETNLWLLSIADIWLNKMAWYYETWQLTSILTYAAQEAQEDLTNVLDL